MRQEGLLRGLRKLTGVSGEEVGCQAGRLVGMHGQTRRKRFAISCALGTIWPTTVNLQVGVRGLAVEDLGRGLGCSRLVRGSILLHLRHMGLRIGRRQIQLAFLEVLNLARGILCAHVAAVQTAHFVAFRRRVLVLELCKRSPDIGLSPVSVYIFTSSSRRCSYIRMAAHDSGDV
jgi:hypothetical protein